MPTSTSVPTIARTIECRNALPTTRTTRHSSPSCSSSNSSIVSTRRTVRWPSRRLGDTERSEIVLAEQMARSLAHRLEVESAPHPPRERLRGRAAGHRRSRAGSGTRARSHRTSPRTPGAHGGARARRCPSPASALSDRTSDVVSAVRPLLASKLTTWPSACTPASVRPAPAVSTSRRSTVASASSSAPCTVRRPGCRAKPANGARRRRPSGRSTRLPAPGQQLVCELGSLMTAVSRRQRAAVTPTTSATQSETRMLGSCKRVLPCPV